MVSVGGMEMEREKGALDGSVDSSSVLAGGHQSWKDRREGSPVMC